MTLRSGVGSVQFYPDKPLLETELNELQNVQNEAREDIIRDSIPSGFTQLGELDYDYMVNNENKVKLKTDSVAYVNGMRIFIPRGTVIDIGKAPEKASREDLLFLEVWKEEVGATGALTEYGGEGQASIPNHILDARVGSETSKRVINRWRIRHVADVDFDTLVLDGFNKADGSMDGDNSKGLTLGVVAQGGNNQPINPSTLVSSNLRLTWGFKSSTKYITENYRNFNDTGLYFAGFVGDINFSKQQLKTADGYVYAIPMFRLYRKPSCGKSIPFEYSKINPKVDYSKFTKLMKEEKVERVITENIKGRSLVNLANKPQSIRLTLSEGNHYSDLKICDTSLVKLNTPYTLSYSLKILTNSTGQNIEGLNHGGQFGLSNGDDVTVAHPEPSTGTYAFAITNLSVKICKTFKSFAQYKGLTIRPLLPATRPITGTLTYEVCDLMLIEGDWTNKEIPYFAGLKSLGEDDGNLVTVKNGILNDSTYDINDGNQKLATCPQITHILSENTITPKVVASVKKGVEVINSLDKLGTKLTAEGTEKIEFTSIKGRTIQNCYPTITPDVFTGFDGAVEDGYILLQGGKSYKNAFIPISKCLIKPNTVYTMIVEVVENTLTQGMVLASKVEEDVFNASPNPSFTKLPAGRTGFHKYLLTSVTQITNNLFGFRAYLSGNELGRIRFKVMLLEGNHANTPIEELPFVEGVKSIGESENNVITLTSCGKNLLYRDSNYHSRAWQSHLKFNTDGSITVTKQAGINSGVYYGAIRYKCNLKEGRKYNAKVKVISGNFTKLAVFSAPNSPFTLANHNEITVMGLNPCNRNCHYIDVLIYTDSEVTVSDIQIEEGTTSTGYEPYTGHTQKVHLKEPLRSLTNEIYDEIIGNKVTRRVGKVILNGSENWQVDHNLHPKLKWWALDNYIRVKGNSDSLAKPIICDKLTVQEENLYSVAKEGIFLEKTGSGITRLQINSTESDIKAWLKQNPITLYYELATPIEEYLENVYEKESIKTYQLDEPLRSLPNGVKDEIKDGVLIRRCAEVTLNGSEPGWTTQPTKTGDRFGYAINLKYRAKNYENQSLHMTGLRLNPANQYSVWETDTDTIYLDNDVHIYTNGGSLDQFKTTLSKNPIKVIYELATPIQIPLAEVKPQTADFSLQRQFAEGNWLRELPNGVRDTIENGKVKRRIGKTTYNGSENWVLSSTYTNDSYGVFAITNGLSGIIVDNTSNNTNLLCNNFKVSTSLFGKSPEECTIVSGTETIWFCILKSRLSSPDAPGFRTWLSQNPTTILYELAKPTTEDLTTKNCRYYPYHDFNTYCGSMYVGEGRNYILSDNKMPSENPVIIETDFREIEDKAKVEDCNFKKSEDGYNTSYKASSSRNLLDISTGNILNTEYVNSYNYTKLDNGFTVSNLVASSYASIRYKVYLKAGVRYKIRYTGQGTHATADLKTMSLGYICHLDNQTVFSVASTGYYSVNFYCTRATSTISTATFKDISITEEVDALIPFEPYIKTTKYFENTKENDIEDLRHQVSLTGFNYSEILERSFDSLLRGEL